MSRDRKMLLSRVRRIGGQVAALEAALERDADRGDALVQIAAAKGAMHGLMLELLSGHLAEHVVAEDDKDKRTAEGDAILVLVRTHMK